MSIEKGIGVRKGFYQGYEAALVQLLAEIRRLETAHLNQTANYTVALSHVRAQVEDLRATAQKEDEEWK